MLITKEMMKENIRRKNLMENLRQSAARVFTDEMVDPLIENDYEFRKNFVLTVLSDVDKSFKEDKLYYIEFYKGRDNFEDLEKGLGDNRTFVNFVKSQFLEYKDGFRGATISEFPEEELLSMDRPVDLPEEFKGTNKSKIIAVNMDNITDLSQEADIGSLLWTIVHEIHHHYPTITKDETATQIRTIDWLIDNEYYETVGVGLTNLITIISGPFKQNDYLNDKIYRHLIVKLGKKDKGKLVDLLLATVDIFEELLDSSEELWNKVGEFSLTWVDYQLLSLGF